MNTNTRFTKDFHPDTVNKLVYYESFFRIEDAIAREKQIKGGSRAKKIALIDKFNPDWDDLYKMFEK